MNKKQIIRLNESQLKQIVNETISEMISELDWKTYANAAKVAKEKGDKRWYKFHDKANKEANQHFFGNENGIYLNDNGVEDNYTKMIDSKMGFGGANVSGNYSDYPFVKRAYRDEGRTWNQGLQQGSRGNLEYVHPDFGGIMAHDASDSEIDRELGDKKDLFMNAYNDAKDFYGNKYNYTSGKGWIKDDDKLNEAISQAIRKILG